MEIPVYPHGAVFPGQDGEDCCTMEEGALVDTTTEQAAPVQVALVETATAEQVTPVHTETVEQPPPVQTPPVDTAPVEPAKAVEEGKTRTVEEIGNFFLTVPDSLTPMGLC